MPAAAAAVARLLLRLLWLLWLRLLRLLLLPMLLLLESLQLNSNKNSVLAQLRHLPRKHKANSRWAPFSHALMPALKSLNCGISLSKLNSGISCPSILEKHAIDSRRGKATSGKLGAPACLRRNK
jgi:hypothetical protein